jgi:hypothetical protein
MRLEGFSGDLLQFSAKEVLGNSPSEICFLPALAISFPSEA